MKYFDLHCDTLLKLKENSKDLSVFKTNCFSEYRQVFSLFINGNDQSPYLTYKQLLNIACKMGNNKYLSLENALPVENNLSRISEFKNDGIKSIMLTWNSQNQYAGGAFSNGNLTELGKKVILKMNQNNIALDVSHLNEQSFFEAVKYADIVLASHSNCKGVFNHKRNLSNDQIKTLISKNGVIGLNYYPKFLNGDVFEKIYENIVYILNLGGENCICFGSDFDGAEMSEKLSNVEQVTDLYKFLLKKGLNNSLLEKLFYNNAKKFYGSF